MGPRTSVAVLHINVSAPVFESIPYSCMSPLVSAESSTCTGLRVMLHVGVPPPPPFPQISVAEERCSRAAPLPTTLHGTAGAQFTSVTAAITKSRVGRILFLLIMTLHSPLSLLSWLLSRRVISRRLVAIAIRTIKCLRRAWKVCPRTNLLQDASTSTLFKRVIKLRVWSLWPA